jgi:hypothetical protein
VGARPSARGSRPHSLESPPEGGGDRGGYRHRFLLRFEELFDELLLELPDALARCEWCEWFELELLDEFELELLEEFELELLDELLDVFELELLEELKLELLDEFELELLDEFELELPADACWVVRADSIARTTDSGGELPTLPSEAAAVATSPHAPSPAAYVFQCLGIFLRLSTIGPRFQWGVAVRLPLVPGHSESSVSRP